jgi:hypothetical protein
MEKRWIIYNLLIGTWSKDEKIFRDKLSYFHDVYLVWDQWSQETIKQQKMTNLEATQQQAFA